MKRMLNVLLVVAFLVSGTGVVLAQETTAPADPAPGSNFQQRLTQRKQERNVSLDERDTRRLRQRCTEAQQRVRAIQQVASQVYDARTDTYRQIDAKLWIIIGRLKLGEADTFKIERQRAELARKAESFQTVMDYYRQTLDDIAVVNCQSDVPGFVALLTTAQLYHDNLRTRYTDIRDYVLDTIKPTLAEHAAALRPEPATEE